MRTGHAPPSIRVLIAGSLLIAAILFGGGGSPAPGAEFVVQVAAIVAIIAWAWLGHRDRGYSRFEIDRSEEHTSELQSLMRISYAVFCLKNNYTRNQTPTYDPTTAEQESYELKCLRS